MKATNGTISSGATEADSAVFDPQLLKDFLHDMSFDCNTYPYARNHDLERMVLIKAANLGLSYGDIQPMTYSHKFACSLAESCYADQPLDFKVFVAMYTWSITTFDDLYMDSPEIQTFALKFGTGEPQGRPHLDSFARFLKQETPKFFGPCVTNLIIISALDGVNGHIIESRFANGFPHSMTGFSAWMRAKTGYADSYGYFQFNEREFPESEWLGRYIQGLPYVRDVFGFINDILSFYKERVLKKENTLISNLAEENGCDAMASLKDLCAQTVTMTHDLRQMFGREGGALLKPFDTFIDGYFKWHLDMDRYRLGEIGLSLKPLNGETKVCK